MDENAGLTARQFGAFVEKEALAYLQMHGLKLVEANYYCKAGEIDLIMQDGETYVFVEVRYRKVSGYGDGVESVTKSKQSKIIRATRMFLQERGLVDKVVCRFDVIAASSDEQKSIIWVKDAFWTKW